KRPDKLLVIHPSTDSDQQNRNGSRTVDISSVDYPLVRTPTSKRIYSTGFVFFGPYASYPKVIKELKQAHDLGRRCPCRPVRYLNNIVEQDHQAIKRQMRASQGFRAYGSAWRTPQGIETMNMIVCPA
ncbi:MAG TPA: DDE-type integrase/transposase/recombinase, partial [Terriglobia bacterium]|nr:DDE-type integrase/transposase/recombinase [Terriglobia bacterium]